MTEETAKPIEATPKQKLEARKLRQKDRELALRERQQSTGVITTGAGGALAFMPRNLPEIVELANVMANGGPAVGKACRGNEGVCASVIMTALGWGMNPFTVSQHVYVTRSKDGGEKIAYEAQLINGVINSRAPLRKKTKIEYEGEGQKLKCILTVYPIDDEEFTFESPIKANITPQNSPLWKSAPRQQIAYWSQRAMARLHFPEIIMGIYGRDELEGADDMPTSRRTAKDAILGMRDNNDEDAVILTINEVEEEDVEEAILVEEDDHEPENAPVVPQDAPQEPEQAQDEETPVEETEVTPEASESEEEKEPELVINGAMEEWMKYIYGESDPGAILEVFNKEADARWRQSLDDMQTGHISTITAERLKDLREQEKTNE